MRDDFPVPSHSLTERRIGAIVTARDESGAEYRARVLAVDGDTVLVRPFQKLAIPSESALFVTLIQALPKKEKMEWIIQKVTEMGVLRIIPCVSEKSVTLEERNPLQTKSHRWQEIARKATEQSRRRVMPLVGPCVSLHEALKTQADVSAWLGLILYEKEPETTVRDLCWDGVERVTIVCGPEGGFAEGEVEMARQLHFRPVSLGGRMLRCETAAIAAVSIIQFLSGNL